MAAGAAVIGTGLQVAGGSQASRATAEAEERNAKLLDEQAKQLKETAKREANLFAEEAEIDFGDSVSSLAKSGVDISSGSAGLFLAEERRRAINEEAAIRINGANQASLTARQAASRRSNARNIRRAIPLQAAGTILTGLSSFED